MVKLIGRAKARPELKKGKIYACSNGCEKKCTCKWEPDPAYPIGKEEVWPLKEVS